MKKKMIRIAIDFDGTIAESAYPGVGKLRLDAKEIINKLYDEGHKILINTCRTGSYEGDAENFLRRSGIKYHYINCNLPEDVISYGQDCRKLSADVYIDDKCLTGLPPWKEIYNILQERFVSPPKHIISGTLDKIDFTHE